MTSYAQFIADFPEFSNATTYPQASFNFWLGLGQKLLNACRWECVLDHGLELFCAHHLTLAAQNAADVAVGGLPGQTKGPVNSKAVHDVSVSYNSDAGLEVGAGHWNLTTYGTQFIHLAKMIGAGGAQLSGASPTVSLFVGSPFFS